jgi:outer membrane protein assembly factor BamB
MRRQRPSRNGLAGSLALVALGLVAGSARADWPQYGGPDRNFKVGSAGLADSWSAAAPRPLWRRPLGEGYSGVAVANRRLFTLYRDGGDEVAAALDPGNGQTLWEQRWPEPDARLNRQYGPGPHSTPLVVAGRVFAVGALGRLAALDAASGRTLWTRELVDDLGGTLMDRGYAPSPIAWRDTVIVPVGGAGHAVVAFRQSDGGLVWSSQDFGNAPSSPLLIDVGGATQLVVFMAAEIAGLDPESGALLWRHEHRTRWDLNISMPVWNAEDGILFYSSAYDAGSGALRLTREGDATRAEPLWFTNQLRIQFTNAMRIGDVVFGSSGDFGPVPMTGVDATTGKILWRDRSFGRSSILHADGKLILLDEDGKLGLARLEESGLDVLGEYQVCDRRTWTPPTLHGRILYVRDREELVALELPGGR